jgi:hypothetical protein
LRHSSSYDRHRDKTFIGGQNKKIFKTNVVNCAGDVKGHRQRLELWGKRIRPSTKSERAKLSSGLQPQPLACIIDHLRSNATHRTFRQRRLSLCHHGRIAGQDRPLWPSGGHHLPGGEHGVQVRSLRSAPYDLGCGPDRRRAGAAARGGVAGVPRRALSRRATRVPPPCPRGVAPTP